MPNLIQGFYSTVCIDLYESGKRVIASEKGSKFKPQLDTLFTTPKSKEVLIKCASDRLADFSGPM